MKIFSSKNVFDAALERINFLFDEFPNVVAGISGGKDSTVIFNLALRVARERGRLPLPVFFIDQEAEWNTTIDTVREIMYSPDVKPLWFQMPIYIENATSYDTKYLKCWDPEAEEDWIHPKDPISIKENTFGTPWFLFLFDKIFKQLYPKQKVAVLSGVRTEESPSRLMGLTHAATYKWITWGRKLTPGQFTFYPLYDWSYTDVWHAIVSEKWPYNALYDLQYQYGVPVKDMRCSNLHHETAVQHLFRLQEMDPGLYERVVNRLPGVDTAGKFGKQFFNRKLPYMFKDWREYRDFLIERLAGNDAVWTKKLKAASVEWDELFVGTEYIDRAAQCVVQSILCNDFNGSKLGGFEQSFCYLWKRDMLNPWHFDSFPRAAHPKKFDILAKRCQRSKTGVYAYKGWRYRIDGETAYRSEATNLHSP